MTGTNRAVVELKRGELLAIRKGGMRVDCLRGQVWITRDWDLRDVILGPGEGFEIQGKHHYLVQALVPSKIEIRQLSAVGAPEFDSPALVTAAC